MSNCVVLLQCIWILVTTAEEFQPELKPEITLGGYIFIAVAVLIGLGIGVLLLLAILKDRKAQAAGVYPQASTSGQKSSVLDFNRGNNAFSRVSLTGSVETINIENETDESKSKKTTMSKTTESTWSKPETSTASQLETEKEPNPDKTVTEESKQETSAESGPNTSMKPTAPINLPDTSYFQSDFGILVGQSSTPPRQTLKRSLSRTAIGSAEPPNRYSVMSNASVITRQASCSSILVRTSPDDAKRPESTRPESTMITVKEQPEELDSKTSSVPKASPSPPIDKTSIPTLSTVNNTTPSPPTAKSTTPTLPTTKAPLKRTMSKSVIVPSKPMNRQMSRTMSRQVLRLGEHAPAPGKAVPKETMKDENQDVPQKNKDEGEQKVEKKEPVIQGSVNVANEGMQQVETKEPVIKEDTNETKKEESSGHETNEANQTEVKEIEKAGVEETKQLQADAANQIQANETTKTDEGVSNKGETESGKTDDDPAKLEPEEMTTEEPEVKQSQFEFIHSDMAVPNTDTEQEKEEKKNLEQEKEEKENVAQEIEKKEKEEPLAEQIEESIKEIMQDD